MEEDENTLRSCVSTLSLVVALGVDGTLRIRAATSYVSISASFSFVATTTSPSKTIPTAARADLNRLVVNARRIAITWNSSEHTLQSSICMAACRTRGEEEVDTTENGGSNAKRVMLRTSICLRPNITFAPDSEAVLFEALTFEVRGGWSREETADAIVDPTALMMVSFVTYEKLFSATATPNDAKTIVRGGGRSSVVELLAFVRLLVRSGWTSRSTDSRTKCAGTLYSVEISPARSTCCAGRSSC